MIPKRYLMFIAFLIATLLIAAISLAVILAIRSPRNNPQSLQSTKGFELYCWSDAGVTRYTLITGTNRAKTQSEITTSKDKIDENGFSQFVNKSQTELFDIYYHYFNLDEAAARAVIQNCSSIDNLAE